MPVPPFPPPFGRNGWIEYLHVAQLPAVAAGAVIAEAVILDLAALPAGFGPFQCVTRWQPISVAVQTTAP